MGRLDELVMHQVDEAIAVSFDLQRKRQVRGGYGCPKRNG